MATQLKPQPEAPAPAPAPPTLKAVPTAPAPIIVKKIIVQGHGGHHGGAWKVAYADFVTAMMAFFMLLWIVGATTEDQRKGIADYFTPTLVQHKNSGGSNGIMGGRSILTPEGNAPHSTPKGAARIVPVATSGALGDDDKSMSATGIPKRPQITVDAKAQATEATDAARFVKVERDLVAKLAADPTLAGLKEQVRFVRTPEGLRIELLDRAGFAMFELGTDRPTPRAQRLVREVASTVAGVPNELTIRGHTDSTPYASGRGMNNWLLSTQRAERTRRSLESGGLLRTRFARLEGVADQEPFNPSDPTDPRNRRISITLLYTTPPTMVR